MIKKKDLSVENKKAWEDYIKNPSDIYDKDKANPENREPKRKIITANCITIFLPIISPTFP